MWLRHLILSCHHLFFRQHLHQLLQGKHFKPLLTSLSETPITKPTRTRRPTQNPSTPKIEMNLHDCNCVKFNDRTRNRSEARPFFARAAARLSPTAVAAGYRLALGGGVRARGGAKRGLLALFMGHRGPYTISVLWGVFARVRQDMAELNLQL